MTPPPRRRAAFDSQEFVAAMAEGGARAERAGRALVNHQRPLLRARFFHAGVAAQDIDDLVADVLTSIVAKAAQLRDHDRFDAWVYTIATNVLNQHWTARGRARDMLQQPAAPAPGDDPGEEVPSFIEGVDDRTLSDPVTALCLQGQLQAFRDKHPSRHACIELLVMGYDTLEIAQQLGRTHGATRQFISQCCAVVMRFLSPCLEAAQLLGRGRGRATAE
jgi:DNA-directed RNA polymerase specialized sigma24 family protein